VEAVDDAVDGRCGNGAEKNLLTGFGWLLWLYTCGDSTPTSTGSISSLADINIGGVLESNMNRCIGLINMVDDLLEVELPLSTTILGVKYVFQWEGGVFNRGE